MTPSATAALLLSFATALLSGCALVEVPVEVVGAVATTTVEVAGAVVEAPFDLIAGDDEPEPAPKPAADDASKAPPK